MRHVLCFGDSNTWGYRPGEGDRYDEQTRWPCVLQKLLGEEWLVHEDGLNGRETVQDHPTRLAVNGKAALPYALLSQKPLDLLVISLGTNDLKRFSAHHAAEGVGMLIGLAQSIDSLRRSSNPVFPHGCRVLVISPVEVSAALAERETDDELRMAHEESLKFPKAYQAVCRTYGVDMIDAQQLTKPSDIDGVHMTAEGHRTVAEAVNAWIRQHM